MPAVVHRRDEGERHDIGSSEILIKATGEDTGGSFFMSETTIEPGFPGPPPHHHERLHDMFYVLEGALTVRLGEDTLQLESGGFVCVETLGPLQVFRIGRTPSRPRSSSPGRFRATVGRAGGRRSLSCIACISAAASEDRRTPAHAVRRLRG
jgi:mannose-6-phosphate isomerase-like protein (cupin superfamily)